MRAVSGVGIGQMRQDFLLERHGDGRAGQGQLARPKVIRSATLWRDEREQNGVDVFAAEGCVVHQRRKRVGDGSPATPKMRVAWSSCSTR